MTEAERPILAALALMCEQYMSDRSGGELDHQCMNAGEQAIAILAQYGLLEPRGRGGLWTRAGRVLLDER